MFHFFYSKCEVIQFYIVQYIFIKIIKMIIKYLNYFDYYIIKIFDIYKIYFDIDNVKNNKFIIILNIIYFVLFDKK